MDFVTIIEQDTIYQYFDGKDLLTETLVERRQMLQKLEQLARAPGWSTSSENIAGFPLVHAQILLFELSVIGEDINTLIVEINSYAERCGKPKVNLVDTELR